MPVLAPVRNGRKTKARGKGKRSNKKRTLSRTAILQNCSSEGDRPRGVFGEPPVLSKDLVDSLTPGRLPLQPVIGSLTLIYVPKRDLAANHSYKGRDANGHRRMYMTPRLTLAGDPPASDPCCASASRDRPSPGLRLLLFPCRPRLCLPLPSALKRARSARLPDSSRSFSRLAFSCAASLPSQ